MKVVKWIAIETGSSIRFVETSFRPIRRVPTNISKRNTSRGTWFRESATTFTSLHDSERNIIAFNMASVVRPTMLRQTCRAAASKHAFSTKLSQAFRPHTKPASALSRQAAQNVFLKDVLPGSMRVAAFHASGQQAILPAEPRMLKIPSFYYPDANVFL